MKSKAVIFDIDGTLSDTPHVSSDRYHEIDWAHWNEQNESCDSFPWCVEMAEMYWDAGYELLFLTSRDNSPRVRASTERWLRKNLSFIKDIHLFMRKSGDLREDHLVKIEAYMDEIRPHYDVKLFVDDRQSNCESFRAIGIPSLCCSDKD